MAIHKLLDDFYEHSYTLIAIHSSLEDYRLAYFINARLNIKLMRLNDTFVDNQNTGFSIFEWDDRFNETTWNLISNVSERKMLQPSNNLFTDNELTLVDYLIPEHKKVDYFFKIDNGEGSEKTKSILKQITEIQQVITAFAVDPNRLKSKNNLIFLSNA